MEPIILPVDKNLIKKELTKEKFLRNTNNGGNKLYIVDHFDSPNTMREIGRLRELAFRAAGGGTGKCIDIDDFDINPEHPYKQLIVWDPTEEEILGGYRYLVCDGVDIKHLATSELFDFSETFQKEYLSNMIELGRSFVQPNYQSTRLRSKGIYALDNLWDGLGALVVEHPDHKYFFGKVTMYTSYNVEARNMILYFLRKYFPDNESLVTPIEPLVTGADESAFDAIFGNKSYEDGYKALQKGIRELGENIPPLINSYMNLSPSMKVFGTAINHEFGAVEETGILVTIGDIYLKKVERHIKSFIPRFIRRKRYK